MAALASIAHLVYFNGINTTGATGFTSIGINPGMGPNGIRAGLVMINVIDLTSLGSDLDVINTFYFGQTYTKNIGNGGTITYGLFQSAGLNYSGKQFLAIFSDASALQLQGQ